MQNCVLMSPEHKHKNMHESIVRVINKLQKPKCPRIEYINYGISIVWNIHNYEKDQNINTYHHMDKDSVKGRNQINYNITT